jgi:MerR family transcriptional regulator, mercuric resistance operon regulatory protein
VVFASFVVDRLDLALRCKVEDNEVRFAMLITRAAELAGVNPQTLRYYERRGLLRPSGRRASGYREYSADDVRAVRFIKRAQELGLSLDDALELLRLRRAAPARREAVRAVAERRLADLDARVRDLQRMRRALRHLVTACRAGRDPHCPILEALDGERETCHDDD